MIRMQLNSEMFNRINYLIGSVDIVTQLPTVPAMEMFAERVVSCLNDVSRELMKDPRSKEYSDVITFAFWIRKGSILKLKERFDSGYGFRLGKGVVFHIAPSNVPVNFAYSLVSGLLCGNANVVRVPSKDFQQVSIITDAFNKVMMNYTEMKPYILCVRYDRNKEINDMFSSFADMRVVWGGNNTIAELRNSPLSPRSGEITFADRYSLALIDADHYLETEDKQKVAEDFYNDTFFSDQNACTSPKIIVWIGKRINEAKELFWKIEHDYVRNKYTFQPIQAVNKLTKCYLIAAQESGIILEGNEDNLIIRMRVPEIKDYLMDFFDNSGYFYEYDCRNIFELVPLCNDIRCQTIAYIGSKDKILPLIKMGVKGIDRVVPMGKTMDFDLIWDGYNLPALLSRTIVMM